MSIETSAPDPWTRLTRALVGGLTVASAGFFLITVLQPEGLDPPPETAALFLVATAAAATSYLLLALELSALGYAASVLTGLYVLVTVAVVVAGTYGPPGPETNPVGPVAWLLLSVAVVGSAARAWRGQ
jgi:hypothetical protein